MGYYLCTEYEIRSIQRTLEHILYAMKDRCAKWKEEAARRTNNQPDYQFDSQAERWEFAMYNLESSISDIQQANCEFENWIRDVLNYFRTQFDSKKELYNEMDKFYSTGRDILKTYKCVNSDRKGITYPIRDLEHFLFSNLFHSKDYGPNIRFMQ